MNPTKVAEDYASEEGFDFARHEDGSVEVYHPRGAARVLPDGTVLSLPTSWITIKFSSRYTKMPEDTRDTRLLTVLKAKVGHLSPEFLEWDTKFADKPGNFPLPAGQDYLVFCYCSQMVAWTTIRAAWPPEKEEYYRSHVGELVNIEVPKS